MHLDARLYATSSDAAHLKQVKFRRLCQKIPFLRLHRNTTDAGNLFTRLSFEKTTFKTRLTKLCLKTILNLSSQQRGIYDTDISKYILIHIDKWLHGYPHPATNIRKIYPHLRDIQLIKQALDCNFVPCTFH